MLQLLSTPRPFLSPNDAFSKHEASRPCTAGREDERRLKRSDSLSHDSIRKRLSFPSRKSSITDLFNGAAKEEIEVPHLIKTPWELDRYKRHSVRRRTRIEPQLPTHVFKKLPREVYDCVVDQLEQLHLGQAEPCSSCYLKDLYNLSLTSRAWDRAATLQLYRRVRVLGNEDDPRLPKLKIPGTSRLKLLRRTLRERKVLARYVRELHLPEFQALYQNATIEREEIVNLVASLVMACPNLERIVGFHIPYTHTFDRLSHALSTRLKLKERVWFLTDTEVQSDDEEDPTQGYYHAACDPFERFLDLNSNHAGLTTLVLHQDVQAATEMTFRAVVGTIRQFPTLRHLSLSDFSSASFSNLALNCLPPNLRSLRLENLPGVNDKGLQRFGSSSAAVSLESITLINLEVSQLATIANFLSYRFSRLKHFSLAQHKAPHLPSGTEIPDLQSPTLSSIHWELRSQAGPPPTLLSPSSAPKRASFPFLNDEPISCLATALLARSICNGLFPSLRRIRAPHDPQGVLQSLCKPLATALLPSDSSFFTALTRPAHPPSPVDSDRAEVVSLKEFLNTAPAGGATGAGAGIGEDRTDSPMSSPLSACFSPDTPVSKRPTSTPLITSLIPARSRLAAQSRVLAARKEPFINVQVHDPKGQLRVDRMINGFLGDVSSKIVYDLRPNRSKISGGSYWEDDDDDDEEAEGANQWITGIGDVMGEWEIVGPVEGGCRHLIAGRSTWTVVDAEELF